MRDRLYEDVQVGEILPPLEFPITQKTLVLAVCGTRDLMPYHHNSAYAKSLGNRDMFVNTMFEQALFGRFTTDWSGPGSDFRETTLQMVGQLCPADIARVEGRVAGMGTESGEPRVRIEMTASNHLGLAARASAVVAMPSRARGEPAAGFALAKPVFEPDPQIPDFAKAWLGDVSEPGWGGYPVSEAQILYWCDMVEDANPLYVDGEYARASRHKGVIAPPVGLITWGMQRAGHQGVDPAAPDCDAPGREPWPPRAARARGFKTPPGATETIAQGSAQAYGVPLRPGDRVYVRSEVVNCSPRKQTRLGPGYFQTNLDTYYNQRHEIVGTNVFTLLRYGLRE
jgi:acyl dehydratase